MQLAFDAAENFHRARAGDPAPEPAILPITVMPALIEETPLPESDVAAGADDAL